MKQRNFYIVKCCGELEEVTGYILDTGKNLYGIDNRGSNSRPSWHVTDIITGFQIRNTSYTTRKAAAESITAELDELIIEKHKSGIFNPAIKLVKAAYDAEETPKQTQKAERKPRTIRNRTYYNFMRVLRVIMGKGYDAETAEQITSRIFDEYEANPEGLPIWSRVGQIADRNESETEAKGIKSEEGKTEETPAESPAEAPQRDAKKPNGQNYKKTTKTAGRGKNRAVNKREALQDLAFSESPVKMARKIGVRNGYEHSVWITRKPCKKLVRPESNAPPRGIKI